MHAKLRVALYQVGDGERALHEATLAIQQNPNDAEAHKAEGLALSVEGRYDAALAEYKEALRIKPDYAMVRYDSGLLYDNRHSYDDAIAEYKKTTGPRYECRKLGRADDAAKVEEGIAKIHRTSE